MGPDERVQRLVRGLALSPHDEALQDAYLRATADGRMEPKLAREHHQSLTSEAIAALAARHDRDVGSYFVGIDPIKRAHHQLLRLALKSIAHPTTRTTPEWARTHVGRESMADKRLKFADKENPGRTPHLARPRTRGIDPTDRDGAVTFDPKERALRTRNALLFAKKDRLERRMPPDKPLDLPEHRDQ